jgi:hypothetical protein
LKEGRDGEERVREGGIGGRPERNRERKAREAKVSTGSSGEDRSMGKGEGHGWELGRAHEVCKRGEDRLAKEYMGSAGVGEDGGRGDRTQLGSMVTIVVVGIVRFQRDEGVRVRETRDWGGRDYSWDKRVSGMRKGRGCIEGRSKGVYKNSGG